MTIEEAHNQLRLERLHTAPPDPVPPAMSVDDTEVRAMIRKAVRLLAEALDDDYRRNKGAA